MRCKCGFENAADARFCGNCRLALGDAPGNAAPPPFVATGVGRAAARPLSRKGMVIVAAAVVVAAAGYWWFNLPPGLYKADNGGLYPININGKYGFMDRSGKTVITPQFDLAYGFSEGLAHVRVGNKSGYINPKGVLVITPQFDDAMQFQYGRAAVKQCCGLWAEQNGSNRFGFIEKDGKYISSPEFHCVGTGFSGDLVSVQTADGALAFMNRSGKVVLSVKTESLRAIGFTAGLAPTASGGKWGILIALVNGSLIHSSKTL